MARVSLRVLLDVGDMGAVVEDKLIHIGRDPTILFFEFSAHFDGGSQVSGTLCGAGGFISLNHGSFINFG